MMKYIKKGDFIIILTVVAVSLCLLLKNFTSYERKYAYVYDNGQLVYKIDLNDEDSYTVNITGGKLLVKDAGISYIDCNCPDKTCEKFGCLNRVGETASCVPNKTVVVIVGDNKSEHDVITY